MIIALFISYFQLIWVFFLVIRVNGTYEALDGGNLSDALLDFTGGISEMIDIKAGGYGSDEEKRKEFFNVLYKHKENHALMCCAVEV